MNGGARRRLTGFNYGDALAAREYAAQHRVVMTDSFTEYRASDCSAGRRPLSLGLSDVGSVVPR